MELRDRVVVVTGGASGLGEATTRMIVEAGGKVLIADVNADLGKRLESELGSVVRFAKCDVTSEIGRAHV